MLRAASIREAETRPISSFSVNWDPGSGARRALNVKTMIKIAGNLISEASVHAARANVALRSLIERGLRLLRVHRDRGRFELRDASVSGRGLQPPFRGTEWTRIRESIYEGRGG